MGEDIRKYCINNELALKLERVAAELGMSTQLVLEGILEQYVARRAMARDNGDESRTFARMRLSLPAMVYFEDESGVYGRYQSATIRDISPNGLGVSCSGLRFCGKLVNEQGSDFPFELMFSVSERMIPIRFKCRSRRVEVVGEELHVGATIEGTDPESNELLQRMLAVGTV